MNRRQEKRNAAEVDQSTIVNLSRRQLNGSEVSVLSKGLTFIPTTNGVDMVKVKSDLVEWERRMWLKEYFYGKEKDGDSEEKPWLKKDSVYTPEPGRNKYLDSFKDKVKKTVIHGVKDHVQLDEGREKGNNIFVK